MSALALKEPPSKYEEMTDDERWSFVQKLVERGLEEGRSLEVRSKRCVDVAHGGSLAQGYFIARIKLSAVQPRACPTCGGSGLGFRDSIDRPGPGSPFYDSCRSCRGTGQVNR